MDIHIGDGYKKLMKYFCIVSYTILTITLFLPASVFSQVRVPVKVGPEFQVNTYTDNNQRVGGGNDRVAMKSDGSFVVVWESTGQDGSAEGVYGQRFDSNGNKVGPEFQINTFTNDFQLVPEIAMAPDGSFVVIWTSNSQDGSGYGIYGQRFDSNGSKTGSEFLINTTTSGHQWSNCVAMGLDGSFVVTWGSYYQDGDSEWGVYGQRFDANGNKVGSEFHINTYTDSHQNGGEIRLGADGSFVIIWHSLGQDGSGDGVYGQRFDANGNKVGSEFQINTYTLNDQGEPQIAMNSDGSFIVVWGSNGQDGSNYGIYAQRFDSNGIKAGLEFQVNTYTNDYQGSPSIVMDSDSFIVIWQSNGQDGSNDGIFGQRFDSNANKVGSEFQVNTYTLNAQSSPSIAMNSDTLFVVVWNSEEQDGSGSGVYGQRFKFKLSQLSKPNSPALLSPSNGATGISTSPTVVWNSSSGAVSYILQVSLSSGFGSYVYNQDVGSDTSKQIIGLSSGTKYYWRVNASNEAGTSDWSSVWNFTTTLSAPDTPALLSPSNGATGISTSPTVVWNSSSRAASYTLQVSLSSGFGSYVYNQDVGSDTSKQIIGLSAGTKYYWRVSASNEAGTSDWSSVLNFTTT